MDLKEFDVIGGANEGFELQLVNYKTQEALPIYITVLGRDSDTFRRLSSEQNRRRVAKMTKGGAVRLSAVSAEEIEADAVEMLAACTLRWREQLSDEANPRDKPTLTINGDEVPCTKANAISVYARFPWIREQVDAAIGDRANFTKG